MSSPNPLLIKRYASRRLYNTETSDYVTLEDVAAFIKAGRDVQIIDLKTGDDLTRQYLLQIITEHEGRGENVLPIEVLTDLVRSYTTQAQSFVPQFLQQSFDAIRQSQSQILENSPLAKMPGVDAFAAQQEAMLNAMMGAWSAFAPNAAASSEPKPAKEEASKDDIASIKSQLAALTSQLDKLSKS